MAPRFVCIAILSVCIKFSCAQNEIDSLPKSSGLSDLLLSARIVCPGENQEIKFPKQFYKASDREEILKISQGQIVKGIPCLEAGKYAAFYSKKKNYCEWWQALSVVPGQCNKWSNAREMGVLPYIKKDLYGKLALNPKLPPIYIPDLCLHYFYLDRDSIPDVIAYDGLDSAGIGTFFLSLQKDSVSLLRGITGYAYEIRNAGNYLLILTKNPANENYVCHRTYKIYKEDKHLKFIDSTIIVSAKGLRLTNYTRDEKFILKTQVSLEKDPGQPDPLDEKFPPGSTGYILGGDNTYLFVAMKNNLSTEKNIFRMLMGKTSAAEINYFYSLGWILKEAVSEK
jgi:hypothetical protein